jgi:hypothetical protein
MGFYDALDEHTMNSQPVIADRTFNEPCDIAKTRSHSDAIS